MRLRKIPTPLSKACANLVRSFALSQFPSWRPFAYGFGQKASIFAVDNVKGNAIDIYTSFGTLDFKSAPAAPGAVIQETYNISHGDFTVSDLQKQTKFSITGEGNLLTSMGGLTMNVYYVFDFGIRTEEQNRLLLPASPNLVVFASRHTIISDLAFEIEDVGGGLSDIKFSGVNAEIISNTIEQISKLFVVT